MNPMRILVTVDPNIPVPPRLYGGIERIVDFVIRGLEARGHQIILLANQDSNTAGTLVGYGVPPHFGWRPRITELWQVGSQLLRRHKEIDLVLSWGRLAALVPVLPLRWLPKIQRYCRDGVPWRSVRIAVAMAGDSIRFSSPSNSVYRGRPTAGRYGGRWQTIHDGIELQKYDFVPQVAPDAPLAFLGLLDPGKGAHTAIAIAEAAGRRLIIAGPRLTQGEHASYFEREIAPHLGDQISYVGAVDDAAKNKLLGGAAALLFPTCFQEAFGIVMAEAMACGTPVIGFPNGAVPEVVRDGVTGFVCRDTQACIAAVVRLTEIDRAVVRAECAARFRAEIIVEQYEQMCAEAIAELRR